MEFVDTHTHLFVSEFDEDRKSVVQRAAEAGVTKLCLPSITEASLPAIMSMCEEYPDVCYPMIGLHPTELDDDYKDVLDRLYLRLKSDNRYIAIGEVGIDLYWDNTRKKEQLDAFCTQIEWAAELGLPLAIHSRNAFNELYESASEKPKSMILTLWPLSVIIMFSGLRSLWMICFLWM